VQHIRFIAAAITAIAGLAWPAAAFPGPYDLFRQAVAAVEGNRTVSMPAEGSIEVGFSPDGGAERLVLKVIDSASSDIKVLAYSFTSAPVTRSLLAARKRGVQVSVIVDHKSNLSDDRSGKARAALAALANAGCDVRTIATYAIHHDKVVIVDRRTVQMGSFNYSASAASRNSENVLVNWDNPKLAEAYLGHFARNYRQSVPYQSRY
jgi:phosphatidylserine/phosphatidylglycerophosphate/cardiolipin synthase-like enzyme